MEIKGTLKYSIQQRTEKRKLDYKTKSKTVDQTQQYRQSH